MDADENEGGVSGRQWQTPRRTPEPPTEFQRFVQAATGRMLPIYAAAMFDRPPSTFAPLDQVPIPTNYVLGPGDVIRLQVWGQLNFSRQLTVDRGGSVYLPEAGTVHVAGLDFAQTQDALKAAIGRVYHNFEMALNLGELRSIQVFVVGQARRPGSYMISSLSTLVNAVFASGGPNARGSLRRIQLKRADRLVSELDLYEFLLDGDKSHDAPLLPGDVIVIPPVGPQAAISGSVSDAAIYELKGKTTLERALAFAGGLSPMAALRHVSIERVESAAAVQTLDVTLDAQGIQTELHNGDIVQVADIVPQFANAVTLRGNVANPRRFPWRSGLKVSDLIPDKEALLTRDYWKERNALGAPRRNELPDPQGEERPPESPETADLRKTAFINERLETNRTDRSLGSGQTSAEGRTIRRFPVRTEVLPPAPDINWEYAVVERLDRQTLTTHLIPFNLGNVVLRHDSSADPALEPGDVVTIFSKADVSAAREGRTKYVRVEGEVGAAGVYTASAGETLRSLVKRAGGITADAYLYGTQFTRESTRKEQQRRFADFLDSMEVQINQSAANLSGRVVAPDQALLSQSTLAGQRALVQKLRETPPTGRIVLDLESTSASIDDLPDIPLEDGDRIFVPSRPNTVNVIGSVQTQASFLYRDKSRLGDYLDQAGGPSRFADHSHIFVIRADGSVVSRPGTGSVFGRKLEGLRMTPGDTLVVPAYINRVTFLRGLTDWSQVIANFALGAAAANVLR